MSNETVKKFLAAAKSGDANAVSATLTEEAGFQALGVDLKGRAAVIDRLTKLDTGAAYREASWSEPVVKAGAFEVSAKLASGSKVTLTLHVKGDKVSLVQQQALPGNPRPASAMKMPPELKTMIDGALLARMPLLIAYTDESGQPILTFRGSIQAYSDDQLAIWIRNPEGKFMRSIGKNPKVALMYRNPETRATYQLYGRARVDGSEAARDKVYASMAQVERDHDFARAGIAVLIDLDLVEGYAALGPQGPVSPIRLQR